MFDGKYLGLPFVPAQSIRARGTPVEPFAQSFQRYSYRPVWILRSPYDQDLVLLMYRVKLL